MLSNSIKQEDIVDDNFERRLFTRRADLTNDIRLSIAANGLLAKLNGTWGTISRLSIEHKVSRPFVYSLVTALTDVGHYIFGDRKDNSYREASRKSSIEMMLSLRLEGRSSIGGISTIMKRFGCQLSGTGSISQRLFQIGSQLPMTVSVAENAPQYLVFASDEIFSKSTPILVTVDPCSSAILRIELADSRKAEDWKNHFECLANNGMAATYLVSDEGSGLCAGHAAALSHVARQSDTYHAIAHQLGSWVDRLEKSAYKAIEKEYECEQKLSSAKSDSTIKKRIEKSDEAAEEGKIAVALYDNFSYLYWQVLNGLNVFDGNGNLRDKQAAKDNLSVGLSLIDELGHENITNAVSKIRRLLPNLFHYFDVAKDVIKECQVLEIDEDSLKAYFSAWQWGKASVKTKNVGRKKVALSEEKFRFEMAEGLRQDESEDVQGGIYSLLDKIVQSSALVECINSIIRPYLNTSKNCISQEMLNLIMHYHNYRRYVDGKRKNQTPMEILTGKAQEGDWFSILCDIVNKKCPELQLI